MTPPCSEAVRARNKPKMCIPSMAVVTSPYNRKILEWEVKQYCIQQVTFLSIPVRQYKTVYPNDVVETLPYELFRISLLSGNILFPCGGAIKYFQEFRK
jgi:hypothetical protein